VQILPTSPTSLMRKDNDNRQFAQNDSVFRSALARELF